MSRPDLQAPPESSASPEPPAAPTVPELLIARLEGRVAALEAALERRSQELRLLQRHLCPIDLAQLARLTAGLPPLPRIACEPGFWRETRDLTEAEVPETMEALWSSLHPLGPAGPSAADGTPVAPVPPVSDDPSGAPSPARTAP